MPDVLERKPPETADDLIQQIEQRNQEIEAVEFKRRDRGKGRIILLTLALISSSAFLVWDSSNRVETPPPFTTEAIQASLEFTLYATVAGLEAHRERTGSLPATLEEAGLDHPSLRYEVGPNGYRIDASDGTHALTFNEGDDLEPFASGAETLRRQASP